MLFKTQRTSVELLAEKHANSLHLYYTDNQEHLEPWEPERPDGYHSEPSWTERARKYQEEHQAGVSLRMVAFEHSGSEIVGVCEFTNITRGPFQACNVGYSVAEEHWNRGLMTEILNGAVSYIFEQLDLHRVMANYLPENERSARVLEKLGFEKEGYANSYLKIAGRWRDHILTAKLNPRHPLE